MHFIPPMHKLTQTASAIAMVRPAAFGYNAETAVNNYFQDIQQKEKPLQEEALKEFDSMVNLLLSNNIDVLVLEDNHLPVKPDAIFPNNWFTCNNDEITVFPMCAVSRRHEKRKELIDRVKEYTGIRKLNDLGNYESKNIFLEGTGSMIIDHVNRIIYACLSLRTHKELLEKYTAENNYSVVSFAATDKAGREIYHTNVMMCIGADFAVVCSDAIIADERNKILSSLSDTGHEIIEISLDQMNSFAGNMLELNNKKERLLLMSKTALNALSPEQVLTLEKYCRIIAPDLSVIEKAAGGSVRCMMAELFF